MNNACDASVTSVGAVGTATTLRVSELVGVNANAK